MKRTITAALAATMATTAAVVIPMGISAPASADPTVLSGKYAIVDGADNAYVDATSSCATYAQPKRSSSVKCSRTRA